VQVTILAVIMYMLGGAAIAAVAATQLRFLWQTGQLPRLLAQYAAAIATIAAFSLVVRHRFYFHFHHYQLGMRLDQMLFIGHG
jgi:hypothetical protein